MSPRRAFFLTITAAVLVGPVSAAAQTTSAGSVSGTVRDALGQPVSGALVSLAPVGGGTPAQLRTSTSGAFAFSQVRAASYEIRVEAIGYRPLVARTLTLAGGERRTLALSLTAEPPPVLTVDTLTLAAGSSGRLRPGSLDITGELLHGLPYRFDDLASLAALSPLFDESLGALGLPGDLSLIIADGLPFYRAPHPSAGAESRPTSLFPRGALSGVTAFHGAPELEWAGAPGGYLSVSTRSSTSGQGVELEGSYSGGATWFSDELDVETPSLASFQAGARGTFDLSGAGGQLVLAGEALGHQTPLAPRVPEALAGDFAALGPDVLATLTRPSVESYSRYTGLARMDTGDGERRIFLRGAGSYTTREFDGLGPVSLARGAAPAETSVDFSAVGGIVGRQSGTTTIELRGGVSGSYRDFESTGDGLPPAFLAQSGLSAGNVLSAVGESSRTDMLLTPIVHVARSAGTLKFGGTARVSRHSMDHSRASLGDFLFTDATGLLAGRGYGQATATGAASFGTQEYGVFADYRFDPRPDVELRVGARYDLERLPGSEAEANLDWFGTAGITNVRFPRSLHQLGFVGSMVWRPASSPGTRVSATASLRDGDVDTRHLHQLFSEDVGATSERFSGSGFDWPASATPPVAAQALPTLTLFGPDMRAPRSQTLSAGLSQQVGRVTVSVAGTMRRTDFLVRRRNLNLPLFARSADAYGREVFGTLAQEGSLVTTTAADARRFADFGDVWALDPDGWSAYRGVTVGLEHSGPWLELHAAYTYSKTDDNWVGAATGLLEASLDPGLPASASEAPWSERVSDFDVRHRASAAATVRAGRVALSGVYAYRSGLPFTPAYRNGVDANGDGSARNDVAFVPADTQLGMLLESWPCLEDQAGSFARRNSCRGPARHEVNLRLQLDLTRVGGRTASLIVDGLNLVEETGGILDDALLLVDPGGAITTSPDGATVTIPVSVNPDFGQPLYATSRGRMVRLGVRIGG